MATIKISNLCPTGFDLFSDSEGYLNELGDSELDAINGGALFTVVAIWGVQIATKYVAGAMVGGAIVGGVAATRG